MTAQAAEKLRVRVADAFGWVTFYDLTPEQYQDYLDASTLQRAKLYVRERKRGPIITDAAAENIASSMRAWRSRWLRRVAS